MAPPRVLPAVLAAAACLAPAASAQFDPPSGQWSKDDPAHLRIMTWNVEDGICRTNDKADPVNDWAALARIVAALQPDVLVLQEAGDNEGQGTGSSPDSVSQLETVLDLFVDGGFDPFEGGAVTEYVRKYAPPSYDLPHVFVSQDYDGFNRNAILSRFPFSDLNGDGEATHDDVPVVLPDAYVPSSGSPEPRGIPIAEIDLPDGTYPLDLVMACCHLKAGSGGDDKAERIDSARRFAYYAHHLLNGAGTGTPDPFDKINDFPEPTAVIGDAALLVHAGDFNDKVYPAEDGVLWASRAENTEGFGGPDGPDQDGTDLAVDDAVEPFTLSPATLGTSKLDYVTWEDSLATAENAFVFQSSAIPFGQHPPELSGFFSPSSASSIASDHRPVILDLELLEVDCDGDGIPDELEPDFDGDGVIDDCDNCPLPNPEQIDLDENGVGDVCEGFWCHETFGAGSMQLAFCGDAFTTTGTVSLAPADAPGFLVVSADKLTVPIPLLPGTDELLVVPDVLLPFTVTDPLITDVTGPISGGTGPTYLVWNAQAAVLDPVTQTVAASNGVEVILLQ